MLTEDSCVNGENLRKKTYPVLLNFIDIHIVEGQVNDLAGAGRRRRVPGLGGR